MLGKKLNKFVAMLRIQNKTHMFRNSPSRAPGVERLSGFAICECRP